MNDIVIMEEQKALKELNGKSSYEFNFDSFEVLELHELVEVYAQQVKN